MTTEAVPVVGTAAFQETIDQETTYRERRNSFASISHLDRLKQETPDKRLWNLTS